MNCTFVDYEPFCRAALSQAGVFAETLGIGPMQADRIREVFERIFPNIDQAVVSAQPEVSALSPLRRATLALYGFIAVAGSDDISDMEIENIASGLFVSRQLVAA